MGTIIKSTSICKNGTHSSIELTVMAAEECIAKAGIDKKDIALLIYAGVYRDNNIAEPAISTLVQKKLGLNNDPILTDQTGTTTFSFDVNNGGCSFLSAVNVAEASLKCKMADYALIVSADTHPSKRFNEDFPFTNVGVAVLLAYDENENHGFKNFTFKTSLNGGSGFESLLKLPEFGLKGREYAFISMDKDYHEQLRNFAVESVQQYIDAKQMKPSDIDYMVTSQQFKGFGKEVSDSIGFDDGPRIIDLFEEYGNPHTSSLPLSYHLVSTAGLLRENDQIFFMAAGSGLSSACALYIV
jgi:3-oxoacyl-[acyl-carrier-protein] synthase-3